MQCNKTKGTSDSDVPLSYSYGSINDNIYYHVYGVCNIHGVHVQYVRGVRVRGVRVEYVRVHSDHPGVRPGVLDDLPDVLCDAPDHLQV